MRAEVREQESPEDRGVLGALLAPVSMLCSFDPPPRRSPASFHQLSADVFNGVHLRDSCCVSVSSPGPGYVWFPLHTGNPSSWVRLLLVWRRVLARVSQFSFSNRSVPHCLSPSASLDGSCTVSPQAHFSCTTPLSGPPEAALLWHTAFVHGLPASAA